MAVWNLSLPTDSEGPTLIPCAARLRSVDHLDLLPAPSWRTVVRLAHQVRAPAHARLHVSLKPCVEHLVQEDIGQHR